MKVAIPAEIHRGEKRVSTSPEVIVKLVDAGFEVIVESGAGAGANVSDDVFREAGAEIDNMTKELPNHIGVELSFMSFLCEREAASIIDDDVNQKVADANSFSQAEIYRAYQIRFPI